MPSRFLHACPRPRHRQVHSCYLKAPHSILFEYSIHVWTVHTIRTVQCGERAGGGLTKKGAGLFEASSRDEEPPAPGSSVKLRSADSSGSRGDEGSRTSPRSRIARFAIHRQYSRQMFACRQPFHFQKDVRVCAQTRGLAGSPAAMLRSCVLRNNTRNLGSVLCPTGTHARPRHRPVPICRHVPYPFGLLRPELTAHPRRCPEASVYLRHGEAASGPRPKQALQKERARQSGDSSRRLYGFRRRHRNSVAVNRSNSLLMSPSGSAQPGAPELSPGASGRGTARARSTRARGAPRRPRRRARVERDMADDDGAAEGRSARRGRQLQPRVTRVSVTGSRTIEAATFFERTCARTRTAPSTKTRRSSLEKFQLCIAAYHCDG